MKNLSWTLALVLTTAGFVSLAEWISRKTAEQSRIAIVDGVAVNRNRFDEVSRNAIKNIAAKEGIAVSRVESIMADKILQAKEDLRRANGGLGPGAFVVSKRKFERVDPDEVRTVKSGYIMNFDDKIYGNSKFHGAAGYINDKSLYIVPLNTKDSGLSAAKFDGYIVEGSYLRGKEYATTEKLRNVESTPSGKAGWTGILRVYSDYPELGRVMLRESDNAAGGITVQIPQNSINAKVGDFPATLIRLQDGRGKTMSAVQWISEGGRTNTIYIKQIDDASVGKMMKMAENLHR